MPGFSPLRIVPFEPQFHWEPSFVACADHINRPHADSPRYRAHTATALLYHHLKLLPGGRPWPSALALQELHQTIFRHEKSSLWREQDVIVGLHKAPPWQQVEPLMQDLDAIYENWNPPWTGSGNGISTFRLSTLLLTATAESAAAS